MFAQIFNSAKRILSRSPSVQEASSEPRDTPPPRIASVHSLEVTMVTTRRGTETPGQEPTSTPRSGSARKTVGKRELDALDTPTAVKRQKTTTPNRTTPKKVTPKKATPKKATPKKKAAVEESVLDSAEDTSDTIAITTSEVQTSAAGGKLAIRRRSSPKVVVGKLSPVESTATEGSEDTPIATQENAFHTPEPQTESTYATPATQKKTDGSPTPRTRRASERTSAKKSSARKNKNAVEVEEVPVDVSPSQSSFPDEIPSSSFNSEKAPISSQDAPLTPAQPKKAHMRFGSEEPLDAVPTPKPIAAPAPIAQDDEDDSASDSDEAPEVVTTTAAASKAAATHHDTARALLAQQEKERARREARDQRIAAEQAAARLRADKKAKKLAKHLAKKQASDLAVTSTTEPTAPVDLAGLLPTSLLDAIPDQRAPTPPLTHGKTEEQRRKEKLNHHVKFLERSEEGIKDVKRGRVSVAVLGRTNGVLPPKANRDTRNVRERWLRGQREGKKANGKGKGGKVDRRGFGIGGFVRDE